MSTQHTSGLEAVNPHFYAAPPWYRTRVFKDHAHCYIATIYNDATREGTGIAQVISTTEPECDANARLIAAAPDLLVLLKQAEAIIRQLDGPRVGSFWLPNFLAGAHYTIAKAEEGALGCPIP